MRATIAVILALVVLEVAALNGSPAQGRAVDTPPVVAERISRFELVDETFMDGVTKLTRLELPLNLGIERALRRKYSDLPHDEARFSLHLANATVKDVLDSLCAHDGRYTWSTDGDSINIYPRSTVGNGLYFLNRQVARITLNAIPDPDEALTSLDKQLPPPREAFGYVQVGGDISYPKPWTVTFEHLTVRQFINRVAEHLGPRSVWIFQGSNDQRFFTFHRGGLTTPTTSEKANR